MVYQRRRAWFRCVAECERKYCMDIPFTNIGFKVVRFTKNHSLLCITGTKENESGYGNAILELSLQGDTLLYLKKGQNDFQQTIHHEILLNSKNQIVTLCREERIFNLLSKGGLQRIPWLGMVSWCWTGRAAEYGNGPYLISSIRY